MALVAIKYFILKALLLGHFNDDGSELLNECCLAIVFLEKIIFSVEDLHTGNWISAHRLEIDHLRLKRANTCAFFIGISNDKMDFFVESTVKKILIF